MRHTAEELFHRLNDLDECVWIEAKGGSESSHSVMETVCAYCNEPNLGGGYILMGIAEDNTGLFSQYKVVPIQNPDKFQRDFATQCANMFNIPVRAELYVEKINGQTVIKIWIDEVPQQQKPVYFKSDGLPSGAFRRIGSTDQHCTEDDMHIFYQDHISFDQTPVRGVSLEDIDETALKRYRSLREKVNPVAEELTYDDAELLQALGCVNREKKTELNVAGLLLFGTSKIQRSTFPMLRVDYIRVQGNSWVSNPDERFTTIDMRGSLILLLYRLIDAINADLPKGFLLPDNDVQASSVGLPMKALREAIVNALMHRSYRENRPTQVIRYDNRIEIINPGFSLKQEDNLGEPGSETRNPFIAAVFHDTNLAETKGSGIRAMRRLMEAAHLVPPTFDSSRENNQFTSRLLLHHFLDESDLLWLKQFQQFDLNDGQKQALIFVREVGAIDNQTYRQMANCDVLKASSELRALKTFDILASKGKGKATYYIGGKLLVSTNEILTTQDGFLSTQSGESLSTQDGSLLNTQDETPKTASQDLSTPPQDLSTPPQDLSTPLIITDEVKIKISELKQRERDAIKVKEIIQTLCNQRAAKATEIAVILEKGEDYIKRKYLSNMIKTGELVYLYPDMINHPEQAYLMKK